MCLGGLNVKKFEVKSDLNDAVLLRFRAEEQRFYPSDKKGFTFNRRLVSLAG